MNEFSKILTSRNLQHRTGEPLWKYQITDFEFEQLKITFLIAQRISEVDPKDCTLYFAEWWKRNYKGGKPSKENIFDSIGRKTTYAFSHKEFYNRAKTGAEMLGIKWIKKQNTLFFRTLLLQGGLPLQHISDNQGNYKNFLLAVLDEQPETIEDFMFQTHITNLLPPSSRNDIIFENCLEIVKSILNDESTYDDLLSSNEKIREISNELRIRKNQLQRRQRLSKLQNYWVLNLKKDKPTINLRLGIANSYTETLLENIFGFSVGERQYQLYINNELICVFRKMLNGNYKTDWRSQYKQEWAENDQFPNCSVIVNSERIEIKDFIQTLPDLTQPSLWAPFSEDEWRLVKGNNSSSQKAAVLFPKDWNADRECETLILSSNTVNWLVFENQIALSWNSEVRNFLTNVSSFDWTIVSQSPKWMLKSNIVVVQIKPKIILYNEKNEIVGNNNYDIYIKPRGTSIEWELLNNVQNLPIGCIDLKIVKDGIKAFDSFFNIGNFKIEYSNQTINSAQIKVLNNGFIFKIDESNELCINQDNNLFNLEINLAGHKIPKSVNASLKKGSSKSLFFEFISPFLGMTLIDGTGNIIAENDHLTFNHLHGIRILSPENGNVIIKFKNALRPDVIISKEIKIASQPLISYRDELLRLYFLADAMNYKNNVIIELQSGNQRKQYFLKGFTHTLSVDQQDENKCSLFDSEDDLILYAVPLNCCVEEISLIPLSKEENFYILPDINIAQQFIIISSYEANRHLMPRFVNTDVNFIGIDKNERIEGYHNQLKDSDFNDEIWKRVLVYFNICISQNLPFSTFDQLRAISRSSEVSSMAFFYLGINQTDSDEYAQKIVPDLEKDLGFCFHWIKRDDWEKALEEAIVFVGNDYFSKVFSLLSNYMHENDLSPISPFLLGQQINNPNIIYNPFINEIRGKLGQRVLNELPEIKPQIIGYYNIPQNNYGTFDLLINAPIAVAESITDLQQEYPIWGGNDLREQIRRNIQYAHYLAPDFYSRIIQQVLSQN